MRMTTPAVEFLATASMPRADRLAHREHLQALARSGADEIRSLLSDPSFDADSKARLLDGICAIESVALTRHAISVLQEHERADIRWYVLQTAFLVRPFLFRRAFLRGLLDADQEVRIACAGYLTVFWRGRFRSEVRDALIRQVQSTQNEDASRVAAIKALLRYSGTIVDDVLSRASASELPTTADAARKVLASRVAWRKRK